MGASATDVFINTISSLYATWNKCKTHLRFGQYVMNNRVEGLPANWPELFFEPGPRVAYVMLYEYAHSLKD